MGWQPKLEPFVAAQGYPLGSNASNFAILATFWGTVDQLKLYNFPVALRLVNWLTILLCCIGIYVAGVLAASHFFNVEVPCGVSSECATVQNHPSSYWFGTPVAYFGVFGYLGMLLLAIWRTFAVPALSKKLSNLLFASSAVGLLASVILQYIAFVEIRASCIWCLGSAGTMAGLFVANAIYNQMMANQSEPAAPKAVEGEDDQSRPQQSEPAKNKGMDLGLIAVVVLGCIVATGLKANSVQGGTPRQRLENLSKLGDNPKAQLIENGHGIGNPDAPIVVVEFADLYCPACRSSFVKMKKLVGESNGKIYWIFRHFPLYRKQGHENAVIAATMAEVAADNGKFFEFLEAVMESDPADSDSPEKLYDLLDGLGIDIAKAQELVGDSNSEPFQRMYSDLALGNLLGLQLTPSFVVIAGDDEPVAVNTEQLQRMLNEPKYRKLMGK